MLTDKENDKSGFDSSQDGGSDSDRKKRPRVRVGEMRQPSLPDNRDRNPYRSSDNNDRPRPSFDNNRGGDSGGERRSYGDQNRQDNRGGGGYSSGGNRDYSSDRGSGYSQDNRERRPYQGGGDRPYQGGGERRPYQGGGDRPYQGGGERRPYQGGGDRSYQGGGERRPYQGGGDRPYQGGGERRPYQGGGDRSYQGSGERRPYQGGGDRKPYQGGGERRSYGDNQRGGGFQRGGFDRRQEESGPKRLVKPVKYKENVDPNTPLRLNKYLANAGVCSRREADAHITAGVVKVNGEVVNELGAKVTRADVVTFHDQVVQIESKVYVLLNKPKNCVTTSDDPQNRLTVMDLVKNACAERIYPVGRLDRNTTGVLLLTNDGDLASKLMHPKYKKKKIYQVTLDRDVTMDDMQTIADGVELDDGEIHADSIAYNSEEDLNVVGIEIHSGRNRIVRRIFEKLNYKVVRLDRVYFSGLTKKNVPRGKWRYLSETEVNMLRMGAFE